MKSKLLLLMGCALALGSSMNAQVFNSAYKESFRHRGVPNADQGMVPQTKPVSATVSHRKASSKNHASALTVIDIGTTPNANGVANNSRSNINYNKDLNTVVLIHRGNNTPPV